MKILEWINFLNEMKLKGKKAYTLAEIANADNTTIKSAKTILQRLKKNNIVINVYKNIWAIPEATVYDIAPYLVPDCYCSMETALFHYNLIKQSPQNFHFVSLQVSDVKNTKLGIVYFHKIKKDLYFGFSSYMAEPEKALLDYLYFCFNDGRKPFVDYDLTAANAPGMHGDTGSAVLVPTHVGASVDPKDRTLTNNKKVRKRKLKTYAKPYPKTVRKYILKFI